MSDSLNPFGRRPPANNNEPFVIKMTPEKIAEAMRLFNEFPVLSREDVAKSIGVSVSTVRTYLPYDCSQTNKRRLDREIMKRAG